jgi:Ala-tRNA(Pro) deacylase
MNVSEKVSRYLENRIPYRIQTHTGPFQGREAENSSQDVCGCLAKSLAVNVDGRIHMVVIPATEQVSLDHLREYLGADKVDLATESECTSLFSECDAGAMPIFGSLYGLPVLVAHELTDNEEIVFNAGTSRDVIRVRLRDFLITERPCVCARNAILSKVS